MIRYDILWHDLVKDLYERCMNYETAAKELEKMHEEEMANANRHVSHALYEILSRTNYEHKKMQEKDAEAQHNANLMLQEILQEILQELKKMNKGKEDEADGEPDREGDDTGSKASGEQNDIL